MFILAFLSLVPRVAAADDADLASRLGVAVRSEHETCLSIPAQGLAKHTPVALVEGSGLPTLARAEIAGAGKGCPGAASHAMAGYRLRIIKGDADKNAVLIAILGTVSFERWGDLMTGKLAPGGPLRSFRSCASAEGVHLTVWNDRDRSRRLWHFYYTLNQDLESTCSDEESRD